MLAHRFSFYMGFRNREGEPAPPAPIPAFDYGTPDAPRISLLSGWARWPSADERYFGIGSPCGA